MFSMRNAADAFRWDPNQLSDRPALHQMWNNWVKDHEDGDANQQNVRRQTHRTQNSSDFAALLESLGAGASLSKLRGHPASSSLMLNSLSKRETITGSERKSAKKSVKQIIDDWQWASHTGGKLII